MCLFILTCHPLPTRGDSVWANILEVRIKKIQRTYSWLATAGVMKWLYSLFSGWGNELKRMDAASLFRLILLPNISRCHELVVTL